MNMNDQRKTSTQDTLLHTCAWCNQYIPPDNEVYGFGARASEGIDLQDKEGQFVSLTLALENKTIFAMVPSQESPARQAGNDLMFITCSHSCAQELKEALESERDVLGSAQ